MNNTQSHVVPIFFPQNKTFSGNLAINTLSNEYHILVSTSLRNKCYVDKTNAYFVWWLNRNAVTYLMEVTCDENVYLTNFTNPQTYQSTYTNLAEEFVWLNAVISGTTGSDR